MSRRILLSMVVVLIITNISTLFLKKEDKDKIVLENETETELTRNSQVASVGEDEVLYGEWLDSLREDQGKMHLKKMIDHMLVKQLAEEEGIAIDSKVIDREIAYLMTMQGVMTQEEREKAEAKWRDDILYRYQLEALLTKDISIADEELKDFYNEYQNQYNFSETIQLSHILVEDNETAKKVIAELEEGASFDLLAQEYSIDEETRNKGGYLGFYIEDSQFLPHGYYEKAENIDKNSYSDPFNAGNQIAIIYVHHKLPSMTFTFDEVKDHIRSELALNESEQTLTVDSLWEKAEIEWIFD